jgi:hypothetical protein
VLPGIHLRVCPRDLALLVDQIADAIGVAGFRIIAGAIRDADLTVGVAQQREGKVEFLGEGGIVLNRVEAGAQNDGVEGVEIGLLIAEPATFNRSTRGIGFRVEPEQHLLAAQVRQRQGRALVRLHSEVRGGVSDLEHGAFSLWPQCARCRRRCKGSMEPMAKLAFP